MSDQQKRQRIPARVHRAQRRERQHRRRVPVHPAALRVAQVVDGRGVFYRFHPPPAEWEGEEEGVACC
jgi:hypothetical protein